MKEFRPPEEPALCADSSAGVPLVHSLNFSWSNRSIEIGILAYVTVVPATPSRCLVFRLRTRHIESPSGLRGIVYLLRLVPLDRGLLAGDLVHHVGDSGSLRVRLARQQVLQREDVALHADVPFKAQGLLRADSPRRHA